MSSNCSRSFQTHLLPPIYGVEMCVVLVGNILALWLLVTKEKKNWHTGVVFSCNLIISDILYALTLPLLIDYYSRGREWKFGNALCKIERFLFTCNLYVSIYFIMCISVNRYLGIVHPFFSRNHVRPKHAKMVSLLVWILVAAISSPILYYSGLKSETSEKRCSMFPDSKPEDMEKLKVIYRLFMAVIGCLFPFIVNFASYIGIICVVWKNANITSSEKKKVSLIVALVCVLYAVSFVPYHILQMQMFQQKKGEKVNCHVRTAYQVSKALACLNMCLHPVLYVAVCDSIRAVCCKRQSKVSNIQIKVGEDVSKDLGLNSKE